MGLHLNEEQFERKLKKIEAAKLDPPSGEWDEGLNAGLDWALRILLGDKSAD